MFVLITLGGMHQCNLSNFMRNLKFSHFPALFPWTVQFRSVDTPTFSSFDNTSIAIGSAAQPLVLTCVYHPPGSCYDGFLNQFLNLLESSVSPSFLICGDFNIHVDTSSNDSIKFQKCLESCNITQNGYPSSWSYSRPCSHSY